MQRTGWIYLAAIYIIWGSTYLAMRVGIAPENGFPVFYFGATRCLVAGFLLLGVSTMTSGWILPQKKDWVQLAGTGLVMWIGAHGLVLWAEQHVASGFAAVAVSPAPIWVMIFSFVLDRKLPKILQMVFIGIGFLGVGVLMFPELKTQQTGSLAALICLVLANMNWSACAVYLNRRPIRLPGFTVSAWQHLFGALGFFAIGLLRHEPLPTPAPQAWGALAFLVIFGSLIAFTSYIKALEIMPAELVTTNTYVNPVIAVLLGWVILKEPITGWTIAAIALVVFSVAGIIRHRLA